MVVERNLSNYSTMADMLGADGSSVVESCREKLPAKAACCMRPDISQVSISPSRLEQIVCGPSRDTQNAWDANLCCCHIRAGELPPNSDDSPGVSSPGSVAAVHTCCIPWSVVVYTDSSYCAHI